MDFQKAFDSVSHEAIWAALTDQGIDSTYVDLLKRIYDGQQAVVQTDQRSEAFPIEKGTKQGDPISPILFNAVVEDLIADIKDKWQKRKYGMNLAYSSGGPYITNLRYADDILLTARSLPQVKQMLADLCLAAQKVGLKLHPEKTKIQHNNIGYGSSATRAVCGNITVDILTRSDFTMYLGRAINLTDMDDEELKHRVAKAWSKFGASGVNLPTAVSPSTYVSACSTRSLHPQCCTGAKLGL